MKKFKSIKDFNSFTQEKTDHAQILIGMGSCGIAAGADKVYKKFVHEIEKRGIDNIEVKLVGCLGLCFSEPNVEIQMKGLPDILYGKVDENFVDRIIEEHINNKSIINKNIYDKPIIDVYNL